MIKIAPSILSCDFSKMGEKKIASYRNIHQHLDLIAGLPYEDYQSFENSFNDVFNLGIEHLQLGFLKMIKGTGVRNTAPLHGYRYKDYPPYEVLYNDYYMTCLPWISIESMTHPLCDNNYESASCPRICWDKYVEVDNQYLMTLNITVSHCFVDGYPLSCAFKNIQENFNNIYDIVK